MPSICVIHWKAAEAAPLLAACRSTCFDVVYAEGGGQAVTRAIRAKLPDVIAIDLSRLPSHGREVAIWLRNTKSTRQIPILFVGGEASKVAAIRELLPDAAFCEISKVATVLKRLLKSARTPDPVKPRSIMARALEKSAAQKLGIEAGAAVAVIEPPRDFPELLGQVPDAVEFQEDEAPVTLWFVHDRVSLMDSSRRMRAAATRTRLWLIWRKGSSGDGLTQNFLRDTAREVGLVDYKICSVNDRWSAMLFARKRA